MTVNEINDWLARDYKTLEGKPKYRLVWSEDAFEQRHGLFRDYYDKILIREVIETREVRKYNYIHERWIFEAWVPPGVLSNKEIPSSMFVGTYEPIYVFEDSQRNYLPPVEKAVRFIIATFEGRVKKDDPKGDEYFEDKQMQREIDEIGNHPSFSTSGPTRDSVAYTSALKGKD